MPGTRGLLLGFAIYAISDAPSDPLTSGFDTAMRGSVSFTVTPSGTGAAGGVAYACGTNAVAAAVGAALCVAAPPAPPGVGVPQAATMVAATAALPEMRVTRRRSSRREMSPSM